MTHKAKACFATLVLAAFPALAQPFVYVTDSGSNSVSVIDAATNTVVATIPVGNDPLGIAITPDGTRAYAANSVDNTVSVIDTATATVVATIPVASAPVGVAITPDGTRAYVANFGSNSVSVIDTTTNKVLTTVNVGTGPYLLAASPDGTSVWVSNQFANTESEIATATNTLVGTFGVGNLPEGVAFNPSGTAIWVTNDLDGTVTELTPLGVPVGTFPVGVNPGAVAVTPNGNFTYVSNSTSANVYVLTASGAFVTAVNVGSHPRGMVFTPDGARVYVANFFSSSVSVIATATNTVMATVPLPAGSAPFWDAITAVAPESIDEFQVGYAANVTGAADSFVNITNDGASDPAATPGTLCVNVYAFDPSEEMLDCCACPVTPNGLVSLSTQNSLLASTATGEKPSSLVIKLVATSNIGAACDASNLSFTALAPGMRAWGTTLHQLSGGTLAMTENSFAQGILSTAEMNHLAGFCAFIEGGLSGHGMCSGCATGGN